jgi:hypothetical protein
VVVLACVGLFAAVRVGVNLREVAVGIHLGLLNCFVFRILCVGLTMPLGSGVAEETRKVVSQHSKQELEVRVLYSCTCSSYFL